MKCQHKRIIGESSPIVTCNLTAAASYNGAKFCERHYNEIIEDVQIYEKEHHDAPYGEGGYAPLCEHCGAEKEIITGMCGSCFRFPSTHTTTCVCDLCCLIECLESSSFTHAH